MEGGDDHTLFDELLGLELSPEGNFLLLVFEKAVMSCALETLGQNRVADIFYDLRNHGGEKIVQARFHPLSDLCVCILTSSRFMIINTYNDEASIQCSVPTHGADDPLSSFCFLSSDEEEFGDAGNRLGDWAPFTVLFLSQVGSVYALCPVPCMAMSVPATTRSALYSRYQH